MIYPAPDVKARPAEPDEIPKTAKTMVEYARSLGWSVRTMYARGVPPEADGSPTYVTVKQPVMGEGGQPVLTPTGRPKMEHVKTDELLKVDVVAVVARRGKRGLAALWQDGSFSCAVTTDLYKLNAAEAKAWLAMDSST